MKFSLAARVIQKSCSRLAHANTVLYVHLMIDKLKRVKKGESVMLARINTLWCALLPQRV